ncbi:hypothetical protein Q7P35_010308 [Cladosporium inversicolor]
MIVPLPSPQTNEVLDKMSEATGYLSTSQLQPNNPKSIMDDAQQPKEDIIASQEPVMEGAQQPLKEDFTTSQNPIMNDSPSKRPWASPPTRIRHRGPYQDDSTYAVICGLQTILARFLIWFNLPLCWFVGISIATRRIDQWLDAHFSGPEARVAIAFVATYIVCTILAHTVAVFIAIGYELWWNPYARAPTLRGEVGREEEVAMVKQNRKIAKRMARTFLPCL